MGASVVPVPAVAVKGTKDGISHGNGGSIVCGETKNKLLTMDEASEYLGIATVAGWIPVKSVPLGKKSRMRPLVFSFMPRSQA